MKSKRSKSAAIDDRASRHVPAHSFKSRLPNKRLDIKEQTWEDFEEQLKEIKRSCKQGRFDEQLRATAVYMYDYLQQVEEKNLPTYWKARTILYELNDIYHLDPAINKWTYDDGPRVYAEIQRLADSWDDGRSPTDKEFRLIKEKILFCGYFGHELKRRNDTNKALELFSWLLGFTNNKLKTRTPCCGTMANLCYHLGSLYRFLEQHEIGEPMYAQALELYYERTRGRAHNDEDDLLFTHRRIAMCIGLGFGWLNLTQGHLRRAENALITARCLLAKSSDPVVPSYIELLYGTIKRCRARKDELEFKEAIKSLYKARDAFKAQGHIRYEARACWELALAFNLMGDFDEADAQLKIVEDFAEYEDDLKWKANVHILRSRIERNRGNYMEALAEAEGALHAAENSTQILPKVDALITRGEAYFYLAENTDQQAMQYDVAREDFQAALKMLHRQESHITDLGQTLNPKIASVCELRIAQCYARVGEEAEAKSHFEQWYVVRSGIEHRWVRDLADEVQAEIAKMSDFFSISSKDQTKWNYSKQVKRLRLWLFTQAMRHTQNNWSEAANLIGVKRATLYQWRYSTDQKAQRARTR